jgi:hypothetical protein
VHRVKGIVLVLLILAMALIVAGMLDAAVASARPMLWPTLYSVITAGAIVHWLYFRRSNKNAAEAADAMIVYVVLGLLAVSAMY